MDQLAAMATFVRVAELGSLSGAARAIPASLTSVSRQIAELERRFGTRLLARTTRRLSLTEDGRLFYDRAKSLLAEFKQIEAALSSKAQEPSGRMRVSAPTLIGRRLIAPMLAEFLNRHPAVSIDLLLIDRAVDVVEEDIHVALRVGRQPSSQLIARKLGEVRMIACASPDYLKRRGVPQNPDDLGHHDCVVFSETPGVGEWRFRAEGKTECKIRIPARLWANSLDALVSATRDGAGIARLPSWLVEPDIRAGGLQRILADHEPPPAPVSLLFESARLSSPKVRLFVDYIAKQWSGTLPLATHPQRAKP
jgi:DNA-binding transcriptional LysR family regulator